MKKRNGNKLFEPLSEDDKKAIARVLKRQEGEEPTPKRLDALSACVLIEGNYTEAIVKNGSFMGIGIAKRNPTDHFDWKIGRTIAIIRAIRSIHPIPLKELA
jgi:hypothetical protein